MMWGRSCITAAVLGAAALNAGCASPLHRAEQVAQRGGLAPLEIRGNGFRLQAFAGFHAESGPAARRSDDRLTIFIGGDGSPWTHGGRRVSADPSPRRPLALELAARTPGAVLYLGRPCYFVLEAPRDAGERLRCPSRYWTSARYGSDVVASLVSAARRYTERHGFRRVLLVGYSGGGTLAALMARDLPSVVGLVSIAGNLDPDAWARLHGYLPLSGSLNPAREPPLPRELPQWYLIGGRDANVPYAAARGYLQRVPPGDIWRFADFDHACCWAGEWPGLFARIRGQLEERGTAAGRRAAARRRGVR